MPGSRSASSCLPAQAPADRFLEALGYGTKGETGGCDVFATRGGEPPVIVELKIFFSPRLIIQGTARQELPTTSISPF